MRPESRSHTTPVPLLCTLLSVYLFPLTHRVTVPFFQFTKNDCGEEGHPAKNKERPVDAVNELRCTGSMAIGNEERSHQRRRSHAKTDGHLLHRARDGACAALLFLTDIRIHQGVHACILQRRE